jgi:hypothetical protein
MNRGRTQVGLGIIAVVAMTSCIRNITRYQPADMCEVHHVALQDNIVHLGYGLPAPVSNEYRVAFETQFPHAMLSANGGCSPNLVFKWARVRACPKCNAAEQEWLKTHYKYRYEAEKASAEVADTAVQDKE